jgi:hypothetical protein
LSSRKAMKGLMNLSCFTPSNPFFLVLHAAMGRLSPRVDTKVDFFNLTEYEMNTKFISRNFVPIISQNFANKCSEISQTEFSWFVLVRFDLKRDPDLGHQIDNVLRNIDKFGHEISRNFVK